MKDEYDIEGYVDSKGIRYLGKAVRTENGKWRALAVIGEALCVVEVNITLDIEGNKAVLT